MSTYDVGPSTRVGGLLTAESGGLGVVDPRALGGTEVREVAEGEGASLVGGGGSGDLWGRDGEGGEDHSEGRVGKLHCRMGGL